ncbi:MAG: hypothetical protein AAF960_09440 [Bacteroidota bacterium]
MKKTVIRHINQRIAEGYEKRNNGDTKACCDHFLNAWKMLKETAPKDVQDFSQLVEAYNKDEADYDWGGWIWEIGEALGTAGQDDSECLAHRIEFIEAFKTRFPATSDEELLEFLQRSLIKTHYLMGNDEMGEQAVRDFYQQYDYSVWGYIEWADALLKRKPSPTEETYQQVLAVYRKGVSLEDDEEFMDILQRRIEKVESILAG